MHPVMKRVVETHGTVAKVYVVPFMLWPEVSLLPIEALYVAAQDGKYYEMLEQQFAAQGPNGYTPAQLRQMAETIGLDGATFQDRLARGLNRQAIVQRRMQISQLGVRGTPVVMINGRFVAAESKTIACLRQMIDEAAAG
jgi:predicted DsbA family dithiol-disulfide isomerase